MDNQIIIDVLLVILLSSGSFAIFTILYVVFGDDIKSWITNMKRKKSSKCIRKDIKRLQKEFKSG